MFASSTHSFPLTQKLSAFLKHLTLSTVVILLFVSFALYTWFPDETMKLTGIGKVFLILIAIDIILGPILTFIVYQPNKKSLKFDLATIVVFQLLAFSYGAYTIYQAHPVYITHTIDRFSLVSARDANPHQAKHQEYQVSKFGSPILAYAESPADPEQRNELMFSVVLKGALDLDARSEYYQPYQENIKNITSRSIDPDILFTNDSERQLLKNHLKEHKIDELAFLPIQGKNHSMIYILERKSATPIGMVDIDPWVKLANQQQEAKNAEQQTTGNSDRNS